MKIAHLLFLILEIIQKSVNPLSFGVWWFWCTFTLFPSLQSLGLWCPRNPLTPQVFLNKYYIIYYYNLHHASVALSRACMMKQYFIHICICMQQEVAGIYICEMQLLTCNLFLCKIEISYFIFYFSSFCSYSPTPSNERRVRRRWLQSYFI